MLVICYDCYGTGEIGVTKDNRVIACETCGGHEDKLGTGRVDVVCAACADKDAEIARLSAELVATMVESHKLTEWLDKRTTTLREALKAAPKPPWNFRPTIGWQGDYCDWYEAQVTLWKGRQ